MTQHTDRISKLKDAADLVTAYARLGTISVGGYCLLLYSNEIGHFPEGLNLGEGLAFYLVCAGFWLIYSMYALVSTAMGTLLLGWPSHLLYRAGLKHRLKNGKNGAATDLPTDFSPMWDMTVWGLAIFGFLILGIYASHDLAAAATFMAVPIVQGILVAVWIVIGRRHSHLQTGLVLGTHSDQIAATKKLSNLTARRVLLGGILICPLLFTPDRSALVDAAFRSAKLRKDNATVHVKKPWSARVSLSTLAPTKSFLGDDYVEYQGVKVLLRSVGEKVIVELPQASGKAAVKLPIPSSSIYVE